MVHFYDTGDRTALDAVVAKTDYFNSVYRREVLAEKVLYDKAIEYTENNETYKIKPIDVLRQLDKNTEPIEDAPPITSDPEFNKKLQDAVSEKAKGKISLDTVGSVIGYANSMLLEMMQKKEIGIEPNHVLAIGWLEHEAFKVLQNLKYEDQYGAYKQVWFQNILKFQELTASSKQFNQEEFDAFLKQIETSDLKTAYRLIAQRTLEHIGELADVYKREGKEDRIGALWSGNVSHELIGMVDLKPAITTFGMRHREEQLRPEPDRLRGD